jgi:hypothetical protein
MDNSVSSYRDAFGKMSAEDIIRADWARNYESEGVPLNLARAAVKVHTDDGLPIARLGNTLILITPKDDFKTVKFHTLTADDFESYFSIILKFLIALNQKRGTQIAYTYLDDKRIFDVIKRNLSSYIFLEPNEDEPQKGKFKLIFEIGQFVSDMENRREVLG